MDATVLAIAMLSAAWGRLDAGALSDRTYLSLAIGAALVGVTVFWTLGLYREVLRYAGPRMWLRLGVACGMVSGALAAGCILFEQRGISRAVLLTFPAVSLIGCGGMRLLVREALAGRTATDRVRREQTPIIIYGAGASGAGLASALAHSPLYQPVAFVDDDPRMVGCRIRDLAVHAPSQLSELRNRHPSAVLVLAIPSAGNAERNRVLRKVLPHGMRIMTVPGLKELMVGQAGFAQLRDIDVQELLGRDAVPPQQHLLARCVSGRNVLVTGAGGSIGSELCRQIIRLRPQRLVLLELSEFALYSIERELAVMARTDPDLRSVPVHAVLGSVGSGVLVQETLREFAIQTVYHAAAHKHVGIVERNEVTGVMTNAFGTATLARAAVKERVETFVLISSDKAACPTGVMGATKRLAELLLQDLAGDGWIASVEPTDGPSTVRRGAACPTRFVTVRFGNVLGSSGSVVPLFLRQIAEGGPVTVTHPDVTRYFMTISEAVNLVIQAGSIGKGGEIFILDMGEPVRIVDLARNLIGLQGLRVRDESHPDGDIAVEFVGLQPGEKLHEVLVSGGHLVGTEHPKIRLAIEPPGPQTAFHDRLSQLETACDRHDAELVRHLLNDLVGSRIPARSPNSTLPLA